MTDLIASGKSVYESTRVKIGSDETLSSNEEGSCIGINLKLYP